MEKFIKLPAIERNAIILNTAEKKNLSLAIVEKDFWVCWTLHYLFNHFKYKNYLCFKGGTCLSKVYHVIERFSEDIDLSMDWSLLNIDEDFAYENRSNRQQDIFNESVNVKAEKYIERVILPLLKKDFSKTIVDKFDLYIDKVDQQTICFKYPQFYEDNSILQIIRIELGALAEPVPAIYKNIQSYISKEYPNIFNNEHLEIKVVDIQRTFFDKITILHREVFRTNGNYPKRYSRHYYDLYQMIQHGIGETALNQIEILDKVVQFKKKFYPCGWAMYDEVLKGGCQLVPSKQAIAVFNEDYRKMKGMIYGKYPEFDEIISTLKKYEKILNETIIENIAMITL